MILRRGLLVAIALILFLPLLGPAGAAPSGLENFALVYGDLTPKLASELGVTVVERYDEFVLVREGDADSDLWEASGLTLQPLPDYYHIYLPTGTLDTSRPLPQLSPDLRGNADDVFMVQMIGPVKAEWTETLQSLGEIHGYMPNFTYLMTLDSRARNQVNRLGFVRWIGPYSAAYRLSPGLDSHDGEVLIHFFGEPDAAIVEQAGLRVMSNAAAGFAVKGSRSALRAAAALPGVAYIEPHIHPELFNNNARTIIRSNVPHARNVIGQGQIGAVTDTGVYLPHEQFSGPGKIHCFIDWANDAYLSSGDGHGHGTHCAGSMLGDAPPYGAYNLYDGQAFGARVIPVKVFTNGGWWFGGSNYHQIWCSAYCAGARVNTNSWGSYTSGTYSLSDHDADRVCRERFEYVLTVANGNGNGAANAQASPATAKNVISVGSVVTNSPEDLSNFSSRGPTADGRIKPDVVAPGNAIMSAQGGTVNGYVNMSGTSMAAPQVAGASLLARDYFMQGFYPSGIARPEHAFEPSSALVKGVLINGAVEITGALADANGEGRWPNSSQGWGRINLDRSLYFRYDRRRVRVWDRPAMLNTGASWTTHYYVPFCARDVKFTLTWTDPPAAVGAPVTLINDLHLRVTSPTGMVYLGNNFVNLNPGYSVPGGYPDVRNNVEGVHIVRNLSQPGLPWGYWRVEVFGANVPQGPQDFALVISSIADLCVVPIDRPVAVIGDWDKRLESFLVSHSLKPWSYGPSDLLDVVADLTDISVVVVNETVDTPEFKVLLEELEARNIGALYLGQKPFSDYGLGVLSSQTGDPAVIHELKVSGPIDAMIVNPHPITASWPAGTMLTLLTGIDLYEQTYDGYSGIDLVAVTSGQPIVGCQDKTASRSVIMGSLGVSAACNTGNWTPDAEKLILNAIEWLR